MPSCASAKAEPTAASPISERKTIAIALNHGEAERVAGTPLTITFEAVSRMYKHEGHEDHKE